MNVAIRNHKKKKQRRSKILKKSFKNNEPKVHENITSRDYEYTLT